MTREAKIGMLTGLGVIVLIGVLLSEYLGGGARALSPTGRMAELPLGAAYRQEVTEPVGVPGMARSDGSGGGNVTVAAGVPSMPALPAVANNDGMAGPTMRSPVSAIPAGRVGTDVPTDGAAPTLQLADGGKGTEAVYVAGQKAAGKGTLTFTDDKAAAAGQTYVIVPGDTLGKISAKFYRTSKAEGMARIVAANPKALKDEKTMLIAGRKLIIPAAVAQAPAKAVAPAASGKVKKSVAVVIHQPGSAAKDVAAGDGGGKLLGPTKSAEAVVVVRSGDTLEKIAKKIAPGNVGEMVKKLEAANGIKDAKGLKVGERLKVPGGV